MQSDISGTRIDFEAKSLRKFALRLGLILLHAHMFTYSRVYSCVQAYSPDKPIHIHQHTHTSPLECTITYTHSQVCVHTHNMLRSL